jgi:putative peptidoglycan lipid II flippase
MIKKSLLISGISIIASLLGLLSQIAIVNKFGVNIEVDAYFYGNSLPFFASAIVVSTLSYTLIPRLSAKSNSDEDVINTINQEIKKYLLKSIFISMLGYIFITLLLEIDASLSNIKNLEETKYIIIIAWLISIIQIINGVLSCGIHAKTMHVTATMLVLPQYIGLIAATLLIESSIIYLSVGMLIGCIFTFIISIYIINPNLKHKSIKTHASTPTKNKSFIFSIIALSCFTIYPIIDSYFAVKIGEGALTYLSYAQRIIISSGGLLVNGPSAIIVPKLALILEQEKYQQFIHESRRILLTTFIFSLVLALIIFVFSERLIESLFVHKEFTNHNASELTTILKFMLPGMIGMFVSVIGFRIFFCIPNVEKYGAAIGLIWIFTYILFCAISYKKLGVIGIAASYSVTWIITSVILLYSIKSLMKKND